ncbi:mediator of RNA polymerase II transcription subunit 12-like [Thrips palmi]|uniref:Mediator of RNA polymerase II transcription subunit 12-like n=1 Tax=Thrips palmi TaxID=161013 RepID=A0A6P8ZQ63_THRPL|nr:mediator of RNA polymerase II transcription subunit 12-like [Thrips palmi]
MDKIQAALLLFGLCLALAYAAPQQQRWWNGRPSRQQWQDGQGGLDQQQQQPQDGDRPRQEWGWPAEQQQQQQQQQGGGAPTPPPADGVLTVLPANCNCPSLDQYNPVCGSDGNTYQNKEKLRCFALCGSNVTYVRLGVCKRRQDVPT